ncbi:helix-turn-helix transcriptional regulator [uncultured Corynebacterium sp.]|uniref:helix-turn-helix domain-containing protein n=1 Tax=uncultured Corynebacterium sp. TaxID=159447 RepID=UPI0025DA035A|nr:helix-turn-helix transcriptional regulator [uncultured Corynebacterium sp.]
MKHDQWLHQITDDSVRSAAKKIDVAPRTLATQLEKGRISPENVIAIAVAYGHHPVGALVDTGYLDAKWAEQVDPARALRTVTEDDLADEVLRRMKLGVERNGSLDTPVDELAQRRHVTPPAYSDVTPDEEDLPYVADNSPDEPMPGDDDYFDGP